VRINHYIAAASGLSRRAADTAVTAGRVTIDQQPAQLGQSVADDAVVTLDGQVLRLPVRYEYIMLHKPTGYVTSRVRQGSDPTIYDLLPPAHQRLRPAGRLDRDSSGLLLLSDDGDFIQRLTHPSHHKEKTYELELDRALAAADRQRLEQGVDLADGPSRLRVTAAKGPHLTVVLGEGRNRQIRRTLGAVGYGIRRLHRVRVGDYELGDLPEGRWRPLPPEARS
jgi:23S rRNA pseudouridine2605 synthase